MAFAEGLFNGMGSLDTCKSQPVYISSTLPTVNFFLFFYFFIFLFFYFFIFFYYATPFIKIKSIDNSVQGQDFLLQPHFACPRWNQTIFSNNELLNKQIYSYGNKTLIPIAKRLTKEYNIEPPLDP